MRICFNTILSSQWKTIYTYKIESGVIKGMQQEKDEKKKKQIQLHFLKATSSSVFQ